MATTTAKKPANSANTAAERAKLEAETAGLLAEDERKAATHKLNLRKERAEIAKLEAEAAVAQGTQRQEEIKLVQAEFAESKRLAHEHHARVYRFTSDVRDDSVKSCINQLNEWSRMYPGADMEVVFYSPGGSVLAGLALFDHIMYLRAQGHAITTGALGYAASMAGILLQAGTTRWVGKESWVLIHEISTLAHGSISDLEDEVAFCKRMQERVVSIFVSRARELLGSKAITAKQFKSNWERKDWWLDSDELVKNGFVDEVRG